MSDTPRTDAAETEANATYRDGEWRSFSRTENNAWALARQLERELATMRLLAAEPHYTKAASDALGPLSLWDKAGLEAEIAARIKAARAEGRPIYSGPELTEAELMNLKPGPIMVVDSQEAKDAARYRFLEQALTVPLAMQSFLAHNNLHPDTFKLGFGEAIDAAIAAKERAGMNGDRP